MQIELKRIQNNIDIETLISQPRGLVKSIMTDSEIGIVLLEIDDTKYASLSTAVQQTVKDKIASIFPGYILKVK